MRLAFRREAVFVQGILGDGAEVSKDKPNPLSIRVAVRQMHNTVDWDLDLSALVRTSRGRYAFLGTLSLVKVIPVCVRGGDLRISAGQAAEFAQPLLSQRSVL